MDAEKPSFFLERVSHVIASFLLLDTSRWFVATHYASFRPSVYTCYRFVEESDSSRE